MTCNKYILTNTGSTLVNFNYRRCDDLMWQYQVELEPNQTKRIWLIDGDYSISPSFRGFVNLIDEGTFPPISISPTPTNTPTNTPTITPTPTPTPTLVVEVLINPLLVGTDEYLSVGTNEYLQY
jgi:hypothetical protein